MITPVQMAAAYIADRAIGDPAWMPHPVRLIGRAVQWLESVLYSNSLVMGALLTLMVVGSTYAASYAVVAGASNHLHAFVAWFIVVYLAASCLALRGLVDSVRKVLDADEITDARERLSHIVGRDTANLDMSAVRRAAIESLAENASDGVIAPMFYLALGGAPLALAYKAASTLDSMVGYNNDRYGLFGRASARLDDALNFIPARITGALICLGAGIVTGGEAMRRSFSVMLRDGDKHKSPNAGVPEAAMAGAIDARLGGPSSYGGVIVEKPYIGDGDDAITPDAASAAVRIVEAASDIAAILLIGLVALLEAPC